MVDGYALVHFPRNTHSLPQPTGDAKWQSMVSAWLGVRFSFLNQGRSDAERDGEKENRMQFNAVCLDQKNPIHSVLFLILVLMPLEVCLSQISNLGLYENR